MKKVYFLLLTLIVLVSSCSERRECEEIEWIIVGKPLNGKGVKKLSGKINSDWIELPYKIGDTVTYFFEDEQWNRLIRLGEEKGINMDDKKYVILSIGKKCRSSF